MKRSGPHSVPVGGGNAPITDDTGSIGSVGQIADLFE